MKYIQGVEVPKDPLSYSVVSNSVEKSETHAGRMFSVSGVLTIGIGDTGSVALTVPEPTKATLVSDMTNPNANVTYTAYREGTRYNGIKVTHVAPSGEDTDLSVVWDGIERSLVVNLEKEAGSVTSTSEEVADAVNALSDVAKILSASAEGDGSGVVNAKSVEELSGGKGKLSVHLVTAGVSVTDGDMTVKLKEDSTFVATGTALTPLNRNRLSDTASQLSVKSNADTTVADGSDKEDLDIMLLASATPGQTRLTLNEVILARGENYLFEIDNESGAENKANYVLQWYETDELEEA